MKTTAHNRLFVPMRWHGNQLASAVFYSMSDHSIDVADEPTAKILSRAGQSACCRLIAETDMFMIRLERSLLGEQQVAGAGG